MKTILLYFTGGIQIFKQNLTWFFTFINLLVYLFISPNEIIAQYSSSDAIPFFSYSINDNQSNVLIDTLNILPLGNSITFDKRSNDTRAIADKYGYRLPLLNFLENDGMHVRFIGSEHSGSNYLFDGNDANGGFPGIKDDQLSNLLKTGWRVQPPDYNIQITQGAYLETYIPDVILLHIGTNGNDLTGGTSPADVAEILDEVDRVENELNKKIDVIIAQIINRAPNQFYVTMFNDSLEFMIMDRINNPSNPAYPDNISVVDMQRDADIIYQIDSMGTIGNGIIGDMNDKLHPNDKGFLKMASVWHEELTSIYPNPITIVNQPNDLETYAGISAQFSLSANSMDTITYQWKRNDLDIIGANDSILIIDSLTMDDDGATFYCEINSGYYTLSSDTVTLAVTDTTVRAVRNLIALYDFSEGSGNILANIANDDSTLNLTIGNTENTTWIPNGLQINDAPNIISDSAASSIVGKIKETNEITLEAWVEPLSDTLNGPARILSIANATSERNVTLGQEEQNFEVRLRTTNTDNNGKPALKTSSNLIENELVHVVYSRDSSGLTNLYLNGVKDTSVYIDGDLSNWDSTYSFSIADEVSFNRVWKGKLYLLGIYNRGLAKDEVERNYNLKFNGYNNLLKKPSYLTANLADSITVLLNWSDNSDNEEGYFVERKVNDIDSSFYNIDTLQSNSITYIDSTFKNDSSYVYRVRAYNGVFVSNYSNEATINGIIVDLKENNVVFNKYELLQNYPNPFNPSTKIVFGIAKPSEVKIQIFNSIGQFVKEIVNEKVLSTGSYTAVLDGKGLASGVYFYRLIANPLDGTLPFVKTNKALFIK